MQPQDSGLKAHGCKQSRQETLLHGQDSPPKTVWKHFPESDKVQKGYLKQQCENV